jgi:ABC-type nitrate/sulfonate/bicarbonate transport system ATPase subunit
MKGSPPLLVADSLTVSRAGYPLFEQWSLEIHAGERFALIGPSGCGKTTLLRMLAGLDMPDGPDSGRITLKPSLRIGMVFQDLALWPNLTSRQNVALALSHLPRRDRARAAQEALRSCQVADLANRRPGTLSIGQQQRVALARALAGNPDLLLLDEPFSSLHPALREELLAMLHALCGVSIALVLVTHDLTEAQRLGCRVLALKTSALSFRV